jgi:hypothetical protein
LTIDVGSPHWARNPPRSARIPGACLFRVRKLRVRSVRATDRSASLKGEPRRRVVVEVTSLRVGTRAAPLKQPASASAFTWRWTVFPRKKSRGPIEAPACRSEPAPCAAFPRKKSRGPIEAVSDHAARAATPAFRVRNRAAPLKPSSRAERSASTPAFRVRNRAAPLKPVACIRSGGVLRLSA